MGETIESIPMTRELFILAMGQYGPWRKADELRKMALAGGADLLSYSGPRGEDISWKAGTLEALPDVDLLKLARFVGMID